jgi:hypothetical protein
MVFAIVRDIDQQNPRQSLSYRQRCTVPPEDESMWGNQMNSSRQDLLSLAWSRGKFWGPPNRVHAREVPKKPPPDDCRAPLYGHLREDGRRVAVRGAQALRRLAGTTRTVMNAPVDGLETGCHRWRDGNGRRTRPSLRTR